MSKAVIYTRVSTDEQAKNGLSLQGQEAEARAFCERQGWDVVEVFCEAGASAKTANRPVLISAMAYCQENAKDVDYFVGWKLDRFARNVADHNTIKAALSKMAIELRSVTEPIDSNPLGQLMETMLSGFAQFDNDVRAERSTNGVKRRLEQGGWPFLAPLGYENFTDSLKRPTLIADAQAQIISRWLRKYLEGKYSQVEMNQLAWDMGIRTKKGKRIGNQVTINMLRNPVYAGLITSNMLDAPVRGLHEGLISVEEHEQIIEKLEGKKKKFHSPTDEWPLRGGFLMCEDCEGIITGSSPKGRSKTYALYHCMNCRAKSVGHRVSIPKEQLHEDFQTLLEQVTPSTDALKLFREVVVRT